MGRRSCGTWGRAIVVAWSLAAACFAGFVSLPAAADDLVVPVDDPAVVALGKEKFGEKCGGFCHGSGGKGGRAPCLICGSFKRGGTDADLFKNIKSGVPGSAMGAFGDMYSDEQIVAIVAFLRAEQKKKAEEAQ
ncbi:MAG: c-type cytochrome [Burkholderiales bacterium]|nr:c-type cytochrome [Burkholderiales bacterium]